MTSITTSPPLTSQPSSSLKPVSRTAKSQKTRKLPAKKERVSDKTELDIEYTNEEFIPTEDIVKSRNQSTQHE